MNLELYFPTPVWWEDTEIDTAPMLKVLEQVREKDPVGRRLSNEGGWQSHDFRPGLYPEMKPLEDRILAQAQQCIRDYGYDERFCFPVIENFWFNVNNKFNTNMVHIHDNTFIAGAFYLKAYSGQGKITFYKDFYHDYVTASQSQIGRYTPLSASAMSFEPRTGKLMLFPGSLPHGVGVNQTDDERISTSFNVKLVRTDDERYWPTTR